MAFPITSATYADGDDLAMLAARTFADTFGHLYAPPDLAAHIAGSCRADYFRRALDKGDTVLLLREAGRAIAYAKVGDVELPVGPHPEGSQGIHRLYIDREFQRQGLGRRILEHLFTLPRIAQAPVLYLGVWEENAAALALYTRFGFTQVGEHVFMVGNHADRDIIMMRAQG